MGELTLHHLSSPDAQRWKMFLCLLLNQLKHRVVTRGWRVVVFVRCSGAPEKCEVGSSRVCKRQKWTDGVPGWSQFLRGRTPASGAVTKLRVGSHDCRSVCSEYETCMYSPYFCRLWTVSCWLWRPMERSSTRPRPSGTSWASIRLNCYSQYSVKIFLCTVLKGKNQEVKQTPSSVISRMSSIRACMISFTWTTERCSSVSSTSPSTPAKPTQTWETRVNI